MQSSQPRWKTSVRRTEKFDQNLKSINNYNNSRDKKNFCLKFTSGQLESSTFDNLLKNFRQMSQKNCSIFRTCNFNDFFPTNFLKISSGQLKFGFYKTCEVFQTLSELVYSQIRETMEKHLVQKNNSRYPSGQLDYKFDNHAENLSPKLWYLPHN